MSTSAMIRLMVTRIDAPIPIASFFHERLPKASFAYSYRANTSQPKSGWEIRSMTMVEKPCLFVGEHKRAVCRADLVIKVSILLTVYRVGATGFNPLSEKSRRRM
jgi:hypothetical protein